MCLFASAYQFLKLSEAVSFIIRTFALLLKWLALVKYSMELTLYCSIRAVKVAFFHLFCLHYPASSRLIQKFLPLFHDSFLFPLSSFCIYSFYLTLKSLLTVRHSISVGGSNSFPSLGYYQFPHSHQQYLSLSCQ